MLSKKEKEIYSWLQENKGYLRKSPEWLMFNTDGNYSISNYRSALKQARNDNPGYSSSKPKVTSKKEPTFVSFKEYLWNLPKERASGGFNATKYDPNNVIFLPDLHAPFIREGVLEFCKEQQEKYNCGTVVFAGDLLDGHAWSYHEHDPDGYGVGDELKAAREQLKPWFKAFPNAISCMGNHDLLIQRKARTIGLSKEFIKGFGDVIGAPKGWEFVLEHRQDNVLYKHGNVGDAFKVAKESRMSTCQGHFHAKTFVQWSVSENDAIFGMQVGWAADRHSYAFDYGKPFANKPIISLGVVLDRGKTPIVKLMDL